AARADGPGRGGDGGQRSHHPLRGRQLRGAGRGPRCARALRRRGGGGVPAAALRARDARPRPHHPHERRAADEQLPAVAVGLLRARVRRRAVARLLARGVPGGAGRVRAPPAPVRGAVMEGRSRPPARRRQTASERRAGRARRRNVRSDLGARLAAAIPAIAFALLIVGLGNWVFVAGLAVLACICLHELFAMYAFTNPSRLAGFTGAIALLVVAHVGDQANVLGAFVACVPWLFVLCLLQPRHAGMPGVAVTMLGLTWIGLA